MKATGWITSAVVVLMCAILQAQPTAAAGVRPEQQISQIETKATKASLRNDVAFFENLMADDYFGIGPAGNLVSKSEAIAERKSGAAAVARHKAIRGAHRSVRRHRDRYWSLDSERDIITARHQRCGPVHPDLSQR